MPPCSSATVFEGRWVSTPGAPPYTSAEAGEVLHPTIGGWGGYAMATHNVTAATRSPSGAPWEWSWEPRGCALPPFRPRRFCEAARDTLLVGDSLMYQTYQSWAAQLGAPPSCETHRAVIGRCAASVCGGKVRLEYVQNKLSDLRKALSWPPAHRAVGEYSAPTPRTPRRATRSTHAAEPPRPYARQRRGHIRTT